MESLKNYWRKLLPIACAALVFATFAGFSPLLAAPTGSVISSATPSNPSPSIGSQIIVAINIDMRGVNTPDNKLGAFTGALEFDTAVLTHASNSGILEGFTGAVNVTSGRIAFNGVNAAGATGNLTVLRITFNVVAVGTSVLDLSYSAMMSAMTFGNLLPILTVNDGQVVSGQVQYVLNMVVSPANSGTTTPAVGIHNYPPETVVELTAVPAAGYVFVNWTGSVADPTSASTTITMTGNKTVTANFAPSEYTLTMAVNPAGGGTTTPAVGNHNFSNGTVVDISAVAADGYQFVNWTGAVADPNSPTTTLTMNANKTVRANFSQNTYTLTMTINPTDAGTTVPAVGVHNYSSGTVVNITALAAAGYRFVNWTGVVAVPENPSTTVTMDNHRTVCANFATVQESVTPPTAPSGAAVGLRGQLLTFSTGGSLSNLEHAVEYEFDWGDGTFSKWGTATDQLSTHITNLTSPNGMSGLLSQGQLVDYESGDPSDIALQVSGGAFYRVVSPVTGAEPAAGTDADKAFNGIVNCLGTITHEGSPDTPLVFSFSGLGVDKKYNLVFYSNAGRSGWDEASLVTLCHAQAFSNESSDGTDDLGNALYAGKTDSSTRLPADNTATGYVARFAQIVPGNDGKVELRIDFNGKAGYESNGKYASALMLQEIDPSSNDTLLTAYNDCAWMDSTRSHIYSLSGTYAVRARARCQTHPDILSEWGPIANVAIAGCAMTIAVDPQGSGQVYRNPDQVDYDFGAKVVLFASANQGFQFSNWNGDSSDTTDVKTFQLYDDLNVVAHFTPATAVEDAVDASDLTFSLSQNYPNPFNPETSISYQVPEASTVVLRIFNALGQEIRTLVNGQQAAGQYDIKWDGRDSAGIKVNSGVYLYRLEVISGKQKYVRDMKMLLLQ